jgi:hypothetical protein
MEICLNQLYDADVRKGQGVIDKNVTAFTRKEAKHCTTNGLTENFEKDGRITKLQKEDR